MPWRIIGASFISLEKGEAGWIPGLMADGYYLVDFDEFGLVWRHADIEDHYACTLGKDGAFEGRDRAGYQKHPDVSTEATDWERVASWPE